MQRHTPSRGFALWRRPRASAWGAMLDQQEILVAALSEQQSGGVRVVVFEPLHAPAGLENPSERDHWLVQTLRGLGAHLPRHLRTMALAVSGERSRQGTLAWDGSRDMRRLQAEVQLEAAAAWAVAPEAIGFDFHIETDAPHVGTQVQWAACLREDLLRWQQQARSAGWRLPVVETENQAAERAAVCLRGDIQQLWAESAQDWQFSRTPERDPDALEWPLLREGGVWKPLVACGAALGALR